MLKVRQVVKTFHGRRTRCIRVETPSSLYYVMPPVGDLQAVKAHVKGVASDLRLEAIGRWNKDAYLSSMMADRLFEGCYDGRYELIIQHWS
jgi:hypothetical protein